MGNRKDNKLSVEQEPKIDLHYLMTQLCRSAKVTTDGEDICSQSFAKSVLDYVCQDLALVEGIRTSVAKRRPFNSGVRREEYSEAQRQPPPTCHLNGHATSSELSQIPPNEINELAVNSTQTDIMDTTSELSPEASVTSSPVSRPSPRLIAELFMLPIGDDTAKLRALWHARTVTDTASNYNTKNDVTITTTPAVSPTLPGEGHNTSCNDLGQPHSTNGTEVPFVNELAEPPQLPSSSSSHQLLPRKPKEMRSHEKKVCTPQDVKINKKRPKRPTKLNAELFACDQTGPDQKRCTSKFDTLSKLKLHLTKTHKMEDPLKEYVIGCTSCGLKFKTRKEFSSHKKTEHTNKKGLEQPEKPLIWPGVSINMTPRPLEPVWSPRNPMLMTPRDVEIDIEEIQEYLPNMNERRIVLGSETPRNIHGVDPPPPRPNPHRYSHQLPQTFYSII